MNLVDRANRQRSLTAISRTLRSGHDANGNLSRWLAPSDRGDCEARDAPRKRDGMPRITGMLKAVPLERGRLARLSVQI